MASIPYFLFLKAIIPHLVIFAIYARLQEEGFLSLGCGRAPEWTYPDAWGIQWVSDSGYVSGGTTYNLPNDDAYLPRRTMRLFQGNQSKYCYNLSNNAVRLGAAFLLRVYIRPGQTPPYTPKSANGTMVFKLIVDANEWSTVSVAVNETYDNEAYVRSQGDFISVCLARSTPDGDAPFINTLELRPLPASFSSVQRMSSTNTILTEVQHYNMAPLEVSLISYPPDIADRYWRNIALDDNGPFYKINLSDIRNLTRPEDIDIAPSTLFQDSWKGSPYLSFYWTQLVPSFTFSMQFYFAEIDPQVNSTGARVFNIFINGLQETSFVGPVDVFAAVGANTPYMVSGGADSDQSGTLSVNLTPSVQSLFPSFLAGIEKFTPTRLEPLTSSHIVAAVEALKSALNLTSYTGDPCLPEGYGYEWMNCSSRDSVTAILLSNSRTGGIIPDEIRSLDTLLEIHLDGSDLQGPIPDLSALERLEILDLRNNRLTGPIPATLAALPNLQALYLQNNNLSGQIPPELLRRKQAYSLVFEYSGNQYLSAEVNQSSPFADSSSGSGSISQRTRTIIIVAALVCFVIIIVVLGIVLYVVCKYRAEKAGTKGESGFYF
ncbi:hypothetical protein KP509_28G008700 [Ceratopteris richardii]|uniref:Malectin-like domain-containing protein n=1 Tax=Ceratopteris richardii TaxID=49495 RepID=A0A8T2R9E1_CERRI|nr:hypothetical protein KP509_28G008700 [Ceratopteris richardii]